MGLGRKVVSLFNHRGDGNRLKQTVVHYVGQMTQGASKYEGADDAGRQIIMNHLVSIYKDPATTNECRSAPPPFRPWVDVLVMDPSAYSVSTTAGF